MLIKSSFTDLLSLIIPVIKANKVPIIIGKPGVGKSALQRHIAESYKLKFIDIRLCTYDPTMFNGFLWLDEGKQRAGFMPLNTFPLDTDPIPEGYNGWMIHLDEFTQMPKSVEGAAYQLVLDRMVGDRKLHPKCIIVCSGNPPGMGMIAKPISSPMRSRLVHFQLENNPKPFIKFAVEEDFHPIITNYLSIANDDMNNFEENHSNPDGTYACERSWEMLSDIIKVILKTEPLSEKHLPIITGTVGEKAGNGIYAFIKSYYACPNISDIAARPESTQIPAQSMEQYAAIAYLVDNTTKNNAASIAIYIKRFNEEFQLIFGRILLKKNESLFDDHFSFLTTLVVKYAI